MLKMLTKGRILVVLIVVLGALGIWIFSYVRTHSFSAREKPNAIETFIARKLRRLAVPAGTAELKNPIKVDPFLLADARDHFADHCAVCHANDGSGRTMINDGLYPPAPDMRLKETQGLTDGELFFIIKNGIRFTGMPGWGGDEEENWKLVLFIRHLPEITDEELRYMREINNLEH